MANLALVSEVVAIRSLSTTWFLNRTSPPTHGYYEALISMASPQPHMTGFKAEHLQFGISHRTIYCNLCVLKVYLNVLKIHN